MKTHRGAAKRFRKTASGKIMRSKAYRRHILTSKTTKRKRGLRQQVEISTADAARVARMLPN
jgi:large subunit ribosomal protein L35